MAEPDAPRGGQALKTAIHVARARTDITSDMELARRAGVSYDTFMNWFSGRTTPRPHEVKKVGDVLGVSYGDLIAAYEGAEPAAVPLEQAVAELIVEIRAAVVDERRARADMMRTITATLAASLISPAPAIATMDVPERPRVGNGSTTR